MKVRRSNTQLCSQHGSGRIPGAPLPYKDNCPRCVETRGHLPPEERDIPGDLNTYRRFGPNRNLRRGWADGWKRKGATS